MSFPYVFPVKNEDLTPMSSGLARALGKPSIIIIWGGQKMPFDVAHDRFLEYDPLDLKPLKEWLKGAFNRVPWRYAFDKKGN